MARGESKLINHNAQDAILEGAKEVYDAVSRVYGPTSSNVAIQRNYGYPTITHDGITVAREIYLKDPDQDTGAGLLVQASDKSNNVSGDGTSATVMLGYHIMRLARQRAAAGFGIMGLRRGIDKAAIKIKQQLDELAKPVPDAELTKVAAISASDPEIGKLVADTVLKVGGVGITVEEYEGLGVMQEVVDGIYFEKGWDLPHFINDRTTEEAVHLNPSILVVEKKLKQNQDIVPIIDMVFKETKQKTLIIIGHVDGQALETCALTNLQGGVRICTIKPPVYGDQELPFLEDIVAMTGGILVASSLPSDQVNAEYLGHAAKVTVAKDHTTILQGDGNKTIINKRLADLKHHLTLPKYSAFQRERMEFRLAKLQGKIGIIRVGGATEAGQKEMKFRVEDAVHATRAAKEEGIVPGGATTLARLSVLTYNTKVTLAPKDAKVKGDKIFTSDPRGVTSIATGVEFASKDEEEGYKIVLEALAEPFKQLMENAGDDGAYRLKQLLTSNPGYGFDVTAMTEDPIDLVKKGVIDPVKVIKSVVENACEVAGIAITIPTTVNIDREAQLEQVALNKAMTGQ